MAAKVWCNDLVQDKGLLLLSTAAKKLVLCTTTPTSKTNATSTTCCCGISTHLDSTHYGAFSGTPAGRIMWFKKTTDITAKKAGYTGSTCTLKAVAIINASTLLFVTKCSTRTYSTAGPDKINASSWAVIFYDPSTAT